jgi:hypothetical protein
VFDLISEQPLPLAAAAKLVPPGRNGKRTHLSTLLRWILRGARSASGQIVKLEGLRLGSRWVTSAQAIQRFAERLTPVNGDTPAPPQPRTATARRRRSERAAKHLEEIGI